ncbi:hypothetical protein PR202_gb00370 [Eleusine coracana subsp. coracana]|uniref:Protein kinase domain-containing protein n=1 Tax=Eleusine coracana subsp. coracana TaxID=191504 RepID=A0AAV5DUP1_ELECO|nr:hypothetical protein QOZ80_5BG0430520 [Eleusine coracana subsp. coracana]GJN13645.1 hypothetical protein PR202_gb00370 [Eleusine coracana subsp. coracana]
MKLRPLSFSARTAPSSPLNPGSDKTQRRRTVVVALRRDAAGRELLTWALVKAAAAGDRVVALHVASSASAEDDAAAEKGRVAVETLGSLLGAYRGFCERNQIELQLTVREAPSIKRALVAEATDYGAAHLVLGVTKTSSSSFSRPSSRSSATAVARYCARRVPASCAVTAVSNGVVVYQRDATAAVQQQQHHHHQQPQLSHYSSMVETPRRLYRKLFDVTMTGGDNKSQDDLAIDQYHGRATCQNMSVSMSALVSPRLRSLTPLRSQKKPEVAAGWPLLRKDFKSALLPEDSSSSEISVVQWAMKLPTRCSQVSPVDSEQISSDKEVDLGKLSPEIEEEEGNQVPEELVALREKYTIFSYSELAKMTHNFSPDRLVGKGGAGRVYRARTDDGTELAVKLLKPSDTAAREFASEVDVLSFVAHRHAMSLAGLCVDDRRLALVYDYVRRGSLEEVLHGGGAFGWPQRVRVAVGVASALEYLHAGDGERRPVIHRDVKSSNILVGDDFEPKLCDFGLAIWAEDAASQVTGDDVAGTFGYLAPEYFMHGKVSDKMDVYAFGVVLLELVSGRKPLSAAGGQKGQESLVMWATSVVQQGKLMDLVDPTLPHAGGEVERMALAAALCIRRAPQRRPTMSNVLKLLTGDGEAVKWAKSQIGVAVDDDECGVANSPDKSDIQSYINLALLDDDDAGSVSSVDFLGANMSLEEYMKGRWSRSSSFDD